MLKAILYDKDGTLMQFDAFWVPVARAAIRQIVESEIKNSRENKTKAGEKIGSDETTDKIIEEICLKIERLVGITGETAAPHGILCGGTYGQFATEITAALKEFGLDCAVDKAAVEEAVAQSVKYGKIVPTCENLRASLLKAREKAVVYVVTTDDREVTEICLKTLGIDDLFNGIYCDDGKTPHKPNPFAADEIAKNSGAEKSEIYMIGDTPTDENFAKNAQINFVCVGSDEDLLSRSALKAANAGEATDLIFKIEEAKQA